MELMRLKKSGEPIEVYGFTYQGNKLHAVVFDKGRFFNDRVDQRRGMYSIPATQVVPYHVDVSRGKVTKSMVVKRIRTYSDEPRLVHTSLHVTSDGEEFMNFNLAYSHEQELVAKELGYALDAVKTFCRDCEP